MACTAPTHRVAQQDESTFVDHAAEWDDLLGRSYDNRLFYSADWHRLWWEHFGDGHAVVLTSRDDSGGLQAALPLQLRPVEGASVLSLLGDYNVADYMDGLAEKPQAPALLVALWTHALEELAWDRLDLRHVPSASPLIPALQQVLADRDVELLIEPDEVCPVALLCSSWDGYLQMLTKKQRHEIRRKLRRAQEGVEWEWRTVQTPEELERDLPVFFRLHEASAREKARFMTEPMRAYFGALTRSLLHRGCLRLSIFRREGEDLAATLAFVHRERYLLYNSGYDPAHSAHSPGIAAVSHAMQDAIEEKAVAFDFLSGDEPYKYQFGATNTQTCRLTASRSR